jgi:hypothetical protein
MRRRITTFALFALVVLGFAGWWFSPTQVLKRRCNSFFDVISFSEKTNPETRHLQVLKLGDFLDRSVALATKDLPEEISNPAPREEIQAVFSGACNACSFITITNREFEFIGIDGDSARVEATVEVAIGHPEGNPSFNGTHRMTLAWHRSGQGWVLTDVSWDKIAP